MSPSHYEVLGVGADAQPDEIRQAYRTRAKQAHPDAGGDAAAFLALREAFEVLGNPLTRKAYDDELGIRPGVRWDSSARTARPGEGWTGPAGDFSGDVEFPNYLRDITDAPWQASAEATAAQDAAATARARSADVAWWWPHQSLTSPVRAGSVILVGIDAAVVAVNPFDGREVWRAGMPASLSGPPVVLGQTIVCWTADGTMHGLELARGVTRWEAAAGPPSSAPLLPLAGTVLAARADGFLTTVSSADGETGWTSRLAGTPSALASDGQHALVVTDATTIEGVDLRKGRHRWRSRSRYPVDLPPVTLGGAAWVSSGRATLHRLDLSTGSANASWSATTAIAGVVADSRLLYVTVAGPAQLVAIDVTGRVRWSVSTEEVSPEPDVTGDVLVLAEPNGRLSTHDRLDGHRLDMVSLPVEPYGPPVVVGEVVVVRERSGRLWGISLPRREDGG